MNDRPDCSVVIVAWNGRDLLRRCLAALQTRPQGAPCETVVVDNASSDGAADAVAREFPQVVLIRNRFNRGFARAVNQGLRSARGRHLILLNPDTLPDPDLPGRLTAFLDTAPDVGLCGVQLLDEDGSRQNSIDNDPTLLTEVLGKGLLRRFFPRRFPSKRAAPTGPVDVETVIGACIAARREALEDAGLLDEGYFLFLEETDWCLAMRRAGWRVVHHPGIRLVHLQGRSKDVAPARVRIEYLRSLFRWFRKNRGRRAWVAIRTIRLARSAVDLAAALLACVVTGCVVRRLRARLRTVAAMLGWQLLLCPATVGLQSREWLREKAGNDFSPDLTPDLAPPPLDDPEALAQRPGTVVLKEVRIKRLLRVPDERGAWMVKQYREARWRAWLRGPRALLEEARAREAALRGVSTLVPAAVAAYRGGSALALRELSEAEPLDAFLLREPGHGRRTAAIQAYGRYARRVHDAGVHQDDFDPNNALLEWDRDGRPRLLLIDHERVTLRPPLSLAERVWNLAKLHRFAAATRTERLRFLRAYCGRGLDGCAGVDALARRVLSAHQRVLARDFARARRSAFSPDRNIGRRDLPRGRLWFRRRIDGVDVPAIDPALLDRVPAAGCMEGPFGVGLLLAWRGADLGEARRVWAEGMGLLRARAPVVPLLFLFEDARGGAILGALDRADGRPLEEALAAAPPATQVGLRATVATARGRLQALGAAAPGWSSRVAGGRVRFLPVTGRTP